MTLRTASVLLLLLLQAAADGQVPPAPPVYSAMQLEQMLAPIALYPDLLLGPVLTASTYPLEIVQADRWLQNDANASLQGMQLADALQEQSWDPSVKALVPFPQVLNLLDNDLDWTEQLGNAFLAQQADVMDAIQRLRARAAAAGTLKSSEQEAVSAGPEGIEIAPAEPDVVYVPVYDPLSAYGGWPSAQYPPDDFIVTGYPFGSFIGITVVSPLWGWEQWDWRHHRLNVISRPGPIRPPLHPGPWQHDPEHRGGVPYVDAPTRARFEGGNDRHPITGEVRGYTPLPGTVTVPPSVRSPLSTPASPIVRPVEPPRNAQSPSEHPGPPPADRFGAPADRFAAPADRFDAPPAARRADPSAGRDDRPRELGLFQRPYAQSPAEHPHPQPPFERSQSPALVTRPPPPGLESPGRGPPMPLPPQRAEGGRTPAPVGNGNSGAASTGGASTPGANAGGTNTGGGTTGSTSRGGGVRGVRPL